MRDDERDVRIFGRHQLNGGDFADRIVEHRQREGARHLADLAADPRIVAVHLNPDEAVLVDCLRHHVEHAATVPRRMHEGKAIEFVRPAGNDPRDGAVGDRVIGMKGGEQDRAIDPRPRRTHHVLFERRGRVPGAGQSVAFSGVAVAVDDHGCIASWGRA